MNLTNLLDLVNGIKIPEAVLEELKTRRQVTGIFYTYYRKRDMIIRERNLPSLDGSHKSSFYNLEGNAIGT